MTAPSRRLGSMALFAGALGVAMPVAADWSARRVYDPFSGQSPCVAETDFVSLHDGYQDTRLRLRVGQQFACGCGWASNPSPSSRSPTSTAVNQAPELRWTISH